MESRVDPNATQIGLQLHHRCPLHPPQANFDDQSSGSNAEERSTISSSSRAQTEAHETAGPLVSTSAGSSSLEQHNSDTLREETRCDGQNQTCESLQAMGLSESAPSAPSTDSASNAHTTASATSPPTSISQDDDLHGDSSTVDTRPTLGSTSDIEVIEICQGTFVAVAQEPCTEDKLQWRALRQRIHMAFAKTCRRYPNLSMQFKLAGASAAHLQPVVLFVCPPDTQKQVRKFVKKQKWLSEAECGYKSLVVDGNFLRVVLDGEGGHDGSLFIRTDMGDVQTLCANMGRLEGVLNPTEAGSRFTIGGVVVVNDTLCCLTTGHVLFNEPDTSEIADMFDEHETDEEDDISSAANTGHPTLSSRPSFDPQDQNSNEYGEALIQGSKETRIGRLLTTSNWKRGVLSSNEDWSLIQLDPACCTDDWIVNQFRYPGSEIQDPHHVIIDQLARTEDEMMDPEVTVLAGCTGPQKGRLNTTAVQLYLDNATFEAREIVTPKPLRMGDSGSWVVHGSKLLGHVFAVQEGTSWSYMIPITQVMEDIQKSLLTYSIELPSRTNQVKSSLLCPKAGRSHASLVAFGINACPNCEQDLLSFEHSVKEVLPKRDTFVQDRGSLDVDEGSNSSLSDSFESLDRGYPSDKVLTVPISYYAEYGNDGLDEKDIQDAFDGGATSWNAACRRLLISELGTW